MKIALFGATGRVGHYVLDKALSEGHSVTALAQSPKKLTAHDKLTIIKGDVRNKQDVNITISGMDIVLSCLGTGENTTLTKATPNMIDSMNKDSIVRIVTIGTAGILESRIEPGKLRYEEKNSFRRSTMAVEDHRKMYDLLRESELNWTIVCPTYLPGGDAQGNYRVEQDYLPVGGKQITVEDTGDFAYYELLANDYVGHRVGIAY